MFDLFFFLSIYFFWWVFLWGWFWCLQVFLLLYLVRAKGILRHAIIPACYANYMYLFSEKKSYLHMSITYTIHTAHAHRFYFFQYLSVLSERLQSILDSRWQVTRHPFRQSRNGEWNEAFKHLGSYLKAELGSCKSHQKSTNHNVKVSKIRDH